MSVGGSVSDARSSSLGGLPKRPIWGMPGPLSNCTISRNRSTNFPEGASRYTAPMCASSSRIGVSRLLITAEPVSIARRSAAEKLNF
jgi:hypothetical protein